MKKETEPNFEDELRPEYDFSNMTGGVKGKYAERFAQSTNVVVLEPDIAKAFPTDAAVNEALRLLIKLAQSQVQST